MPGLALVGEGQRRVVDAAGDRARREDARPRRRELDGERQAVEPAADLRDRRRIPRIERAQVAVVARPPQEELRRGRRLDVDPGGGADQALEPDLVLFGAPERDPARREDREAFRAGEQARQQGACLEQVLEVVDDEQVRRSAEALDDGRLEIPLRRLARADARRDRVEHAGERGHGREVHEGDRSPDGGEPRRDLVREPGLADAAEAGDVTRRWAASAASRSASSCCRPTSGSCSSMRASAVAAGKGARRSAVRQTAKRPKELPS